MGVVANALAKVISVVLTKATKGDYRRRHLAFAGAGMAGVYVGVWLEEPNAPGNRPREQTSDRSRRLLDGGVADSPAHQWTTARGMRSTGFDQMAVVAA